MKTLSLLSAFVLGASATISVAEVITWGSCNTGTAGVPTSGSLTSLVHIGSSSLTNVTAVAAGVNHTLALTADGEVIGWGWNRAGIATGSQERNHEYASGRVTTNTVAVTPYLRFFLSKRGDYRPQFNVRADEEITCNLVSDGTNSVFHRRLPRPQAFEFRLIDHRGQELPKTKLGNENSQAAKAPVNRFDILKLKPEYTSYSSYQLFRPEEMFMITNSGVYELEVRIRLCVPMTNGVPDSFGMLNNSGFLRSTEFGLITSDPVRIKVLKE